MSFIEGWICSKKISIHSLFAMEPAFTVNPFPDRPTDRPPRIATPQTQRWSAHPGRPKLPIAIPPKSALYLFNKKRLRRETVLSFKFISLNCGGRIESQTHLFNNLHTKKTVPLVPMWRVKRGRLFPTVPEQRDITLIVCCLDLWRSPRVRRTH